MLVNQIIQVASEPTRIDKGDQSKDRYVETADIKQRPVQMRYVRVPV
jgi:hypothetical protein